MPRSNKQIFKFFIVFINYITNNVIFQIKKLMFSDNLCTPNPFMMINKKLPLKWFILLRKPVPVPTPTVSPLFSSSLWKQKKKYYTMNKSFTWLSTLSWSIFLNFLMYILIALEPIFKINVIICFISIQII